jgi:hypothetical protein
MILIVSLLMGVFCHAEDAVTMSLPDTFCKVTEFTSRKDGKPFKKCDRLKDSADAKIKSMEGCKDRALEKANQCMKINADAEQITVKAKYMERFKNTSNATSFNCEVDSKGGAACP